MLSLDLFDSKFEKKLHEGAVDSTIEHLLKPLSLRAAEIRTQLRGGKLNPKQIDQLEREYEDLVQKRLDLVMNRRTQTEQQQPQHAPAKGLLKNKDLVTPQQRVAAATPPKTGMLSKARDTLGSFANWLAGKDDVGPTYENSQLDEQDPNSAINAAKYVWEQIRQAHDKNVDIATIRWMNNSEPVTMSRNQLYHTVQKLKAMSRQNRNAFATQTLADRNNFYLWLGGQKKVTPRPQLKQPSDPFQPELPLGKPKIGPVQERVQKKKSDDIQAGDVKVARELQKLRAQYPAARSDVEAVARAEIDSSERSNQQIAAIRGANEKQDALLRQLVALDREQGREIDSLDSENNDLEKQLAQVQATNDRLQKAIGQMTGTKTSPRTKTTTKQQPTAAPATADVDSATVKKVQDLETQINQLQSRPSTPEIEKKIDALQNRINALPAQAAQALNIDQDKKPDTTTTKVQAPAGDLDIKPTKAKTTKAKTTKAKTAKATPLVPGNDLNFLDIEEPDMLAVNEHGGGIGPRQHWQDLMPEGWSDKYNPTPYAVYIDGRQWKEFHTDDEARRVADKVRANLKLQGRDQQVTIAPSQAWLKKESISETPGSKLELAAGEFIKGIYDPAGPVYRAAYRSFQKGQEAEAILRKHIAQKYGVNEKDLSDAETSYRASRLAGSRRKKDSDIDDLINENVRDTASATAVIACLLAGGSLQGCATAPQQTTAQQVLKTGQDVGRTVQTAKRITRAGVEAEVDQEIRNLARGLGNRPEELNNSNILRIWRKIQGRPPVQPEPQAPEYGPAEPVKRTPQYEAKEIHTREDFVRERDRLLRMIGLETDPANKQILKSAIRQLENRAENEGWLTIQQRMVREDIASQDAEQAILKRIMVAHLDLLRQYGPQKVMQAAEEVAYNVGDIAEIGTSDVSAWVDQVKQILGADS